MKNSVVLALAVAAASMLVPGSATTSAQESSVRDIAKVDCKTVMRLDDRLRVTPGPPLWADLKALLGPNCLAGA